ncbi:MAG: hypothetical protein NUW08_00650 [Candidatus Uhrbacteria bacterium]|nr:hypothetical protein [Candidatus Uhrbacteria bacterium]
MNILKEIGRRVDALVEKARQLVAHKAYQTYNHGDAFKRLRELGDGQISAIVLDVNQRIAKPASVRTLLAALEEIEDRIYTDPQVAPEARLAARSVIAKARNDLHSEALSLN